jgi:geranylgeranyl pyrophosphate synthase
MTVSISTQTNLRSNHDAHNQLNMDMSAVAKSQELVKYELQRVEKTLLDLSALEPASLRNAVEVIVSSGGKRLRPMITLLAASLFGACDQRVIDLASAVEMLHTATLVHDDLIDGSLMRRGASTLNAAWTPAATVLTGDFLFAVAAGLAARAGSVHVMDIFAETLSVIVAGELRQQFTDWSKRSTREDYYARIYAKTASMFVLAVSAAGVVNNANVSEISALTAFGRDFGLAFQIIDDILDFTGDQVSVGKPVGSDLRQGLITLPTICYHEEHPDDEDLACALRGECDHKTYDMLVARIRDSDAIRKSLLEASNLVASAKSAIEAIPDSEYKDALIALADYTIQRNK